MIYYKLIKISIDIPGFVKIIINNVVRYYGLLNFIITDQNLLFTLKFLFLQCYFLKIKQKLSIAFHF